MIVERLSLLTGQSASQLSNFAKSAGIKYKIFEITKKNGGKRLIEQPSKAVKLLQRWVTKTVFNKYPIHSSAMGYRNDISVKHNAEIHLNFKYTLRLDFKNFFWSFKKQHIINYLTERKDIDLNLSANDINFIANLTTRNDRLTMGAPSSPIITNILMEQLDAELWEIAFQNECVYTRYADDIFISSNIKGITGKIFHEVVACISKQSKINLTINFEKTLFLSKKRHREVTGIVLSTSGFLSIGRDRKRIIKSKIFKAINGELTQDELANLAGLINWANSIEPCFVQNLIRKYSEGTISLLSKSRALHLNA